MGCVPERRPDGDATGGAPGMVAVECARPSINVLAINY